MAGPLPFAETHKFFPAYTPEERVAVYAMLGGIPGYWKHFDPEKNLHENIRHCFLSAETNFCNPFFQEEPALLFREYGDNLPTYGSILRAIAQGKRRLYSIAVPSAIARQARLNREQVVMNLQSPGIEAWKRWIAGLPGVFPLNRRQVAELDVSVSVLG